MNGFPTRAPAELEERARQQQWLIDTLWSEQGVGIVGGEPKCGKSFLALDLAVAVAAGVPCLGHFAAARGPVLLFCAEDAGHIVRHRLEGICHAAGAAFETLDIAVIDVPVLRLDHGQDRSRLLETVERISPRLLVLDPLVRLHAIDENAAADVVPILGFLRDIQRRFETAVMLVHHARKSGGSRPGQALRGSSDLHAWGNAAPVVMPNGERRTAPALAFSAVWLGITSGRDGEQSSFSQPTENEQCLFYPDRESWRAPLWPTSPPSTSPSFATCVVESRFQRRGVAGTSVLPSTS